jgi:guanine deaminase
MNDSRNFLEKAVKLAAEGIEKGGGPFGALIVKDGEIIAEAVNQVVQSGDPTAHAEILAIRKAAGIVRNHNLDECVLYASCEPCPMCLGAIYWSGIRTIYFASDRKDASAAGFNDEFIYNELNLPYSRRKLDFYKMEEVDGSEVFRIWNLFENKIPY